MCDRRGLILTLTLGKGIWGLGLSARHSEGRVRVRDRVKVRAISSAARFGMQIMALRNDGPESV